LTWAFVGHRTWAVCMGWGMGGCAWRDALRTALCSELLHGLCCCSNLSLPSLETALPSPFWGPSGCAPLWCIEHGALGKSRHLHFFSPLESNCAHLIRAGARQDIPRRPSAFGLKESLCQHVLFLKEVRALSFVSMIVFQACLLCFGWRACHADDELGWFA
jgi:hypothetical protein